jgi:hypothetical protein
LFLLLLSIVPLFPLLLSPAHLFLLCLLFLPSICFSSFSPQRPASLCPCPLLGPSRPASSYCRPTNPSHPNPSPNPRPGPGRSAPVTPRIDPPFPVADPRPVSARGPGGVGAGWPAGQPGTGPGQGSGSKVVSERSGEIGAARATATRTEGGCSKGGSRPWNDGGADSEAGAGWINRFSWLSESRHCPQDLDF